MNFLDTCFLSRFFFNSIYRERLALDHLRESILARVCCLSRFIRTVCQRWFRPEWRGHVGGLCTAASFCFSPPLSFYYLLTFLATLLMGEPSLLVLGGFSQWSGVAVSLMSAEQVNLFITLWLIFLGGAGIWKATGSLYEKEKMCLWRIAQ